VKNYYINSELKVKIIMMMMWIQS